MSGILNSLFHVLAFVETCIVHNDNSTGRQLGNKIACQPTMEYITVNVAWKQTNSEQGTAQQCPDYIGTPLGMPVTGAKTAQTLERIAVCARHIMGKTTFINIDNGFAGLLMPDDLLLEGSTFGCVRPGMAKGFFYMSHQAFAMPARSPWVSRQSALLVRIGRRQDAFPHPS